MSGHARDSLDDLLERVQVLRVGFDDREPMLFDIVQEGSLRRLSMALEIDENAHAAELAAAERRGAVRALREAAEELYQWVGLGADDEVHLGDVAKGLKIRADREERADDE